MVCEICPVFLKRNIWWCLFSFDSFHGNFGTICFCKRTTLFPYNKTLFPINSCLQKCPLVGRSTVRIYSLFFIVRLIVLCYFIYDPDSVHCCAMSLSRWLPKEFYEIENRTFRHGISSLFKITSQTKTNFVAKNVQLLMAKPPPSPKKSDSTQNQQKILRFSAQK